MLSKFVLGLDGGGTKTELAAVGVDGQLWFRLRGGPININGTSRQEVFDTITELLSSVRDKVGDASLSAVCIGAAGMSNIKAEETLRAALKYSECRVPALIVGDQQAALSGALGSPVGMLLIAGTGSICCGRNESGIEARSGGRGHLIDDEGSGYAIGRNILSSVVRAKDGRLPPTILTELVFEKLGISTVEELVSEVYRPNQGKDFIAGFSSLLPEALELKDDTALKICLKASSELCALVTPVAKKLGLQNGTLALSGSVLVKDEAVRRYFKDKLAQNLPELKTVSPQADAAVGAALLALNLLKKGDKVEN